MERDRLILILYYFTHSRICNIDVKLKIFKQLQCKEPRFTPFSLIS